MGTMHSHITVQICVENENYSLVAEHAVDRIMYARMQIRWLYSHTELRTENKDNLYLLVSEWLQFKHYTYTGLLW